MSSKQKFILAHDIARQRALEAVKSAPVGFSVTVQEPSRSTDQNSLTHAFYADLAKLLPENDALGWRCYCKLHHGVPLLRAEDEDFKAFYDSAVKRLSYEQKIEAMKFVPVTSIMTKGQLTKFADAVIADFQNRGIGLIGMRAAA